MWKFDDCHEPWQCDGPILRIEYSRVSKTRHGALTLVIDPINGSPMAVCWSISRRSTIDEVAEALRLREGTGLRNIGRFYLTDQENSADKETLATIRAWAVKRGLDGVAWTDLRSNFACKAGQPFSVDAAVRYLEALDGYAQAKAFEYIRSAPNSVRTPLRATFAGRLKNTQG